MIDAAVTLWVAVAVYLACWFVADAIVRAVMFYISEER
jgi:hypothetical protein